MLVKKILARVFAVSVLFLSQNAFAADANKNWREKIFALDTMYWNAYNNADPKTMTSFLADDAEFYHDRGGTLIGKAAIAKANEEMKPETHHLRRAVVEGSVKLFPMRDGETIYGAIMMGEHQFFKTEDGKPDRLLGKAFFNHLLLLKNGEWKIARIFSYEHADAKK